MGGNEVIDDKKSLPETRNRRWFILVTSSMAEVAVARRLKRLMGGAENDGEMLCDAVVTCIPTARWSVRRQGKSVAMERILFRGYLFAGFTTSPASPEPPWFDIRTVAGLHGVLSREGAPIEVAAEMVGGVISRCETGLYRPSEEPVVQRSMRVVARGGRFRHQEGDVVKVDRARGMAEVLFELLGTVPVRVHLDDLVSVAYSDSRMIG